MIVLSDRKRKGNKLLKDFVATVVMSEYPGVIDWVNRIYWFYSVLVSLVSWVKVMHLL